MSSEHHPSWRCYSSWRRLARASSTSVFGENGSAAAITAFFGPSPLLVAMSATATAWARRRRPSPSCLPLSLYLRPCASSTSAAPHCGEVLLLRRSRRKSRRSCATPSPGRRDSAASA